MNGRRATVSLVALSALVAFACGSKTTGSASPATAACDDYYDAYLAVAACGSIPLPASEVARTRPRFEAVCTAQLALPGTETTAAAFEACAKAALAAPCTLTFEQCSAPPGTLPPGASCVSSSQCTTVCETSSTGSADGGATSSGCGVCAPSLAAGEPCEGASPGICAPGTTCGYDKAPPVCETVTYGAVGAPCDHSGALCAAGLACGETTKTCVAPGPAGTVCSSDLQCATGLACTGGVCVTPQSAGGTCNPADNSPCAAGLACDSTTLKCVPYTWASAGQPCGSTVLCLTGSCSSALTGAATGTCPTIVADGQPCPTDANSSCDVFAQCVGGVCTLESVGSCK